MNAWRTSVDTAYDENREARFPFPSKLKIYRGMEDGCFTPLDGAGLNLSELGAAFVVNCELSVGDSIYLELPKSRMSVSGTVRSCIPVDGGWRIGMEFDGEMIKVA